MNPHALALLNTNIYADRRDKQNHRDSWGVSITWEALAIEKTLICRALHSRTQTPDTHTRTHTRTYTHGHVHSYTHTCARTRQQSSAVKQPLQVRSSWFQKSHCYERKFGDTTMNGRIVEKFLKIRVYTPASRSLQ